MRRLLVLLVLLAPLTAAAQDKIYRIAVLEREPSAAYKPNFDAFRQGLRELGYVEGKNLAIGYRSADGQDERYPALCAEAIQRKADLILAHGTPAVMACKKATSSIPILFSGVADPVADGLVADIGRPGGNVTGIMYASGPLVMTARLELLKEVFPRIAVIGAIVNLGGAELSRQRQLLESTGRVLGIGVRFFDVRSLADLQTAFAQAANERLEAVYVASDELLEVNRKLVGDLALRHHLPTVTAEANFVEDGSLLSYGADMAVQYRRLAGAADRIFRGGNTGEIPVDRPAVFMLAINQKTAKALRVRIPSYVLSRADRVIQ